MQISRPTSKAGLAVYTDMNASTLGLRIDVDWRNSGDWQLFLVSTLIRGVVLYLLNQHTPF